MKKRKYGVWLSNFVDSADDEWFYVSASSLKEVKKKLAEEDLYNENRFSVGAIMPIKEFRKRYGLWNVTS